MITIANFKHLCFCVRSPSTFSKTVQEPCDGAVSDAGSSEGDRLNELEKPPGIDDNDPIAQLAWKAAVKQTGLAESDDLVSQLRLRAAVNAVGADQCFF